jgi:hypothetical protein
VNQIKAPWTDEQVATLNAYQKPPSMYHPFTCGSLDHPRIEEVPFGEFEKGRTLIATNNGWHCPTCPYVQDWAWDFMFTPLGKWSRS